MQIGLVGLGKMGLNLSLNMVRQHHQVHAYDLNEALLAKAEKDGIKVFTSLEALVSSMSSRRVIWLMIPAGNVDKAIHQLTGLLDKDDIIIDGGNSNYKDTLRRSEALRAQDIQFLDVGTSGGLEGALHGACTMVGGEPNTFRFCEDLLKSISVKNGCLYCGPSGAGHFVKMVHNGIEYGMMQSIAEGFEVLERSEFGLPLEKIADVWNNGSVIRSWLIELTARALQKDPGLESIRGTMHSSGEGKWTLDTALEKQIATPVIALSVLMRYRSLQDDTFSGKVVAALRNEFGGHSVDSKEPQ